MSLTTVNVDVRDDRIGIRKAELDRLMIRGDKLTIRGYEFSSGSIKQSTKGDVSPFFLFPPAVPPPPPLLVEGLLHYIVLFGSSWFYTC